MSNAVFDSVKNQAANTLSGSFKKVVGGIFNSKGSSSTSAFKDLGAPTESKHLSYPDNVDTDPMQGHWVLFEILQLNESKIEVASQQRSAAADYFGAGGEEAAKKYTKTHHNGDEPPIGKGNTNLSGGRTLYKLMAEASVKLDKTIALYMPPSVSVSYNANYADKEIGGLAGMAGDVIQAFTSGGGKDLTSKLQEAFKAGVPHAEEGLRAMMIKGADAVAPGVEALAAIQSGKILGNHMELLFQGVGRRSFSFTFVFIPKSEKEATTVQNICKLFKFHMMPEWANKTTKRAMTIPDMFDITYMYQKGPTPYLNKISTCFCKSAQVTYGGSRYTAYTDGSPQRTTLALEFQEIDIMTRDRISDGY